MERGCRVLSFTNLIVILEFGYLDAELSKLLNNLPPKTSPHPLAGSMLALNAPPYSIIEPSTRASMKGTGHIPTISFQQVTHNRNRPTRNQPPGTLTFPILPPSLNPLVTILIQLPKILPHLLLPPLHHIPLPDRLEPLAQPSDRRRVESILMRLQVAQLRELLTAVV